MTRLGVDLGATWLRACLVEDGRHVWTRRAHAVNWRRATALIKALLRRGGPARVDELVLGGTRLGDARDRAAFAKALKRVARKVRVAADFEIAHLAVFGGAPGLLASPAPAAWPGPSVPRAPRAPAAGGLTTATKAWASGSGAKALLGGRAPRARACRIR